MYTYIKKQNIVKRWKRFLGVVLALVVVAAGAILTSSVKPSHAAAAQLSLSPSSQTVSAGATFTVTINLATGGSNIDTVQAALSYPASQLSCITTGNTSDFSIVPQADSCSGGNVLIQRGRTGSFNSDGGVATITFKALTAGTSPTVSFTGSTAAYSAGNVVAVGTASGTYTIPAPPPPPPSPSPSPSPSPAPSSPPSSPSTGHSSSPSTPTPSPSSPAPTPASPAAPSSPPTIGNLDVTGVTDTSATVTWDTDQPATSEVGYGLNQSYQLAAGNPGLTTTHSVSLSPSLLQRGLTYYVKVTSTNASGMSSTSTTTFITTGFAITVHIVNSQGQSLVGATVTLDGKSYKTDSQGNVTFASVPYGQQSIQISYGGSTTKSSINVGRPGPNGQIPTNQSFKLVAATSPPLGGAGLLGLIGLLILIVAGVVWRYRVEFQRLWAHFYPQPPLTVGTGPAGTTFNSPVGPTQTGASPAGPSSPESLSTASPMPMADLAPVTPTNDSSQPSSPIPGSRFEPTAAPTEAPAEAPAEAENNDEAKTPPEDTTEDTAGAQAIGGAGDSGATTTINIQEPAASSPEASEDEADSPHENAGDVMPDISSTPDAQDSTADSVLDIGPEPKPEIEPEPEPEPGSEI